MRQKRGLKEREPRAVTRIGCFRGPRADCAFGFERFRPLKRGRGGAQRAPPHQPLLTHHPTFPFPIDNQWRNGNFSRFSGPNNYNYF